MLFNRNASPRPLKRTSTLFAPVGAILLFSLFSSNAFASIPWRVNVQRAVSEASAAGKPLFVTVSTSWCHYCKKLDRETLSNNSVADHIENCFVPLKIDGDANRELAQMLGVRSYPTMVIMSPNMKVLSKLKGYRTANQLNGVLESICASHETHETHDRTPARHPNALASTTDVSVSTNAALNPSVFGDHCPVTSFRARQLTKSGRKHPLKYRGFDVWFASAEARDAFQENPDRYWPLLDGYCVVSAIDENVLRLGDWASGVSYADRIWFFSTASHMEKFNESSYQYLRRLMNLADRHATNNQPTTH